MFSSLFHISSYLAWYKHIWWSSHAFQVSQTSFNEFIPLPVVECEGTSWGVAWFCLQCRHSAIIFVHLCQLRSTSTKIAGVLSCQSQWVFTVVLRATGIFGNEGYQSLPYLFLSHWGKSWWRGYLLSLSLTYRNICSGCDTIIWCEEFMLCSGSWGLDCRHTWRWHGLWVHGSNGTNVLGISIRWCQVGICVPAVGVCGAVREPGYR